MKRNKWILVTLVSVIFLATRIVVLKNPPYVEGTKDKPGYGYSDVKHDSERYANMWYYGLTPYRKHLYEYPPIAIPFVYLPLVVDQLGIGHYYPNYRFEIFLFESILFGFLITTVMKIWKHNIGRQYVMLIYYCLIGLVGKDFWYDGLDLIFIGFFALALMVRYLFDENKLIIKVIFWALFSASFGVKYMTAPLALPLLILYKKNWKREVLAGVIGFLLVWGVPIGLYRSSLSVMVLFHTARPFNYGSLGKWLINAINDFTHTETQTAILPHLPLVGPISEVVTKSFGILFPLASIVSLGYCSLIAKKTKYVAKGEQLSISIIFTMIFFMSVFLTNKVFSNPFHIWYIPLLVLMPNIPWIDQAWLMLGASVMFFLDTTPFIRVPNGTIGGVVPYQRIRDLWRFIPMIGFLVYFIKIRQSKVDRHE